MQTNKLINQTQPRISQKTSLQWFSDKIKELKSFKNPRIKFEPGRLFFFYYDPKTKETLSYYDKFPIVIPLELYADGFLGLNLHYLPFNYRKVFLTSLAQYSTVDKNNDVQRYRITYDILKVSKRSSAFRPCLKRYLFNHVRTKILPIQPTDWNTALFLPVQSFVGARPEKVWQESIQQIKDETEE